MGSTASATAAPQKGGRHQRSIKNYLIDSRFQLKYTAMIVSVAIVISGVLGLSLYKTSRTLVAQSQLVVDESKKVSEVVKMTIKDDPFYSENPELTKSFSDASEGSDKKVEEQQQALIHGQQAMLWSLVGGLSLMVVLIGLLGIYFTHKVAGPIYKMKMLLREAGKGKLSFKGRLRKGDELQDFFQAFQDMIEGLRELQSKEVERLETAIKAAGSSGASAESLEQLQRVRDEMQAMLDE